MNTNNPPSPIDFARTVIGEMSDWMGNHPVLETEEDTRHAKLLLDRAKAALDDVEKDRTDKVKPLNDQVAEINLSYKGFHNTDPKKPGTLNKVVNILKQRIHAYLLIEEARRRRVAEEKAAAAVAAEAAAREAERLEREAIANAKVGEADIDLMALTAEADASFNISEVARREAQRAQREAQSVKAVGGFGNSISVRTVEVLEVDDWKEAIVDMGLTDGVRDAILTAARAFRAATGDLPNGVVARHERKL